ncbi:MAG: hypothetical protein KME06_18175 [Kastovskya adunca ATA6-11-RM4]|nr:hypothetical protein [Kastovskya adunca ATA6-11-RM4]
MLIGVYIYDAAVSGVTIGAQLDVSEPIEDNTRVFNLTLEAESNRIDAVLGKSPEL